jgi:hypothetical protein
MLGFNDEVAPHHISFEAYGVPVRILTNSDDLLPEIELLLPPRSKRLGELASASAQRLGIILEEDTTYSVYNGANRAMEGVARGLALIMLDNQIQSYVGLNSPDRIFLHAGVVASEGRAVMIPGASFSGKTMLVEALVRRGATYYSDEFAVVDSDGLVHPYARPLTIRHLKVEGDHRSGDRDVESLGGVAGEEPVPLGRVVITHYVPGAQWSPRRLSQGEAVLALLENALPARYRPDEAMRILANAVDGVPVVQGQRGEADEFAETLLEGAVA